MRQLLTASVGVRQAWKHQQNSKRLLPPARAFKWEPLNRLKEKLPNLAVLRERFPIKWPLLGKDRSEAAASKEAAREQLRLPESSVRAAVQQGTLGFGFSAGGMLFPYYIGVTQMLTELGVLTGDTPLAGASAGSLVVACHHCGLDPSLVTAACLELAADCRQGGTRGRLGQVLYKCLKQLLPEDSHERIKGKAFIAVTRAFPVARGELISEFKDKDDLISALMTSCHIPWWFDNSLVTTFRGNLCYDGGLTQFIPLPPSASVGVRVCCLPAKQLNTLYPIDITPDRFEDWPYTASEMLAWAFEPAEEEVLKELIAKGRKDAESWAVASGAAKAAGGQENVEEAKEQMKDEEYPVLKS